MAARLPRALAALTIGLCVAALLDRVLASGVSFQAHAIVGMSDDLYEGVPASARAASEQASIAAALSRSVLVRAAARLRTKGFAGPNPSAFDRLGVALGLEDASSGDARVESMLAERVSASRGATPGTVAIAANDETPETAALIATSFAEAFVADQDQAAADMRRTRDDAAAARRKALAAALDAARQHLAAYGTAGNDPVQERAEAVLATTAAKARMEAFRTVLASGSPPLGAAPGLPSSIGPLQADYLDLKRQLTEAQRTLGERHTIVIGLEDGVKQAAKALGAEWKRLALGAEADWKRAGEREALLAKTDTARDAKTRQALDAARDAVKAAEKALASFQAAEAAPLATDRHFRLIATAAIPTTETGLPFVLRLVLDGMAGLFAAGLVGRPRRRHGSDAARDAADDARLDATADQDVEPDAVPAPRHGWTPVPVAPLARSGRPTTAAPVEKARRLGPVFKARPTREHHGVPAAAARAPAPPSSAIPDRSSLRGLRDVAIDLARVAPGQAPFAIVLVGGEEPASEATPTVLGLARLAADAGARVLLIESERSRPLLAGAVGLDARPQLVDILGQLRVAFRDEPSARGLFLAPGFADLRRLAAGLARRDDIAFVDEATDAFDLVIVDGGSLTAETAEDWSGLADAFVRIGRAVSTREDEAFLDAMGGSFARFLGTIAPMSAARPAVTGNEPDRAAHDVAPGPQAIRPAASRIRVPVVQTGERAPRRRVASR